MANWWACLLTGDWDFLLTGDPWIKELVVASEAGLYFVAVKSPEFFSK